MTSYANERWRASICNGRQVTRWWIEYSLPLLVAAAKGCVCIDLSWYHVKVQSRIISTNPTASLISCPHVSITAAAPFTIAPTILPSQTICRKLIDKLAWGWGRLLVRVKDIQLRLSVPYFHCNPQITDLTGIDLTCNFTISQTGLLSTWFRVTDCHQHVYLSESPNDIYTSHARNLRTRQSPLRASRCNAGLRSPM